MRQLLGSARAPSAALRWEGRMTGLDLETRVQHRKAELIAEIIEHKKNSSRVGAADAIARIKAHLSELAHIVKEGVVDNWANVDPKARTRLDAWLAT
jgi:hypothetical protein